jgi:hypothetical protein
VRKQRSRESALAGTDFDDERTGMFAAAGVPASGFVRNGLLTNYLFTSGLLTNGVLTSGLLTNGYGDAFEDRSAREKVLSEAAAHPESQPLTLI